MQAAFRLYRAKLFAGTSCRRTRGATSKSLLRLFGSPISPIRYLSNLTRCSPLGEATFVDLVNIFEYFKSSRRAELEADFRAPGRVLSPSCELQTQNGKRSSGLVQQTGHHVPYHDSTLSDLRSDPHRCLITRGTVHSLAQRGRSVFPL